MADVRPESGRGRFEGLRLSLSEVRRLRALEREGSHSRKTWIRIRSLLLLHEGKAVSVIAEALGTYPRTVRRVGWRYVDGGLEHALSEEERPKEAKMFDDTQQQEIAAIACSQAPEGRSRWTVRLLAEEVQRRGISKSVGRETIRLVLKEHGLKPWRKKNVVRGKA